MTQDDARKYLIGLLPPGADRLYDLQPGGDVFKLFDAIAAVFKQYGFDLLDRLRQELFPSKASDKLPDWEGFLGVARFFVARFGTLMQRQQGVVSKIRERGAFTDPNTSSIIAPLLGYFATTPLEILRCDRSALRLLHTYQTPLTSIPNATTVDQTLYVVDGGKVSAAGPRLTLEFGAAGPFDFVITLESPDSSSKSWSLTNVDGAMLKSLFAGELAGAGITGNWLVRIANTSGVALPVITSLFVEGIARNQNTAGAAWHWAVYADPALVGQAGFSDFEAVESAIARIKHTHDVGRLVTSKEPWPGVESGLHSSIPARCIPSA